MGYDIRNSAEDNRIMALWMERRCGPTIWNTYKGDRPKIACNPDKYVLEAPVAPEKSDRVPRWTANHMTVSGSVWVFDDTDNKYGFDPDGTLTTTDGTVILVIPGDPHWYTYQSKSEEAVNVTVTRQQ